MKTTVIDKVPENITIEMVECVDRAGRSYRHPFVGKYALTQRLMDVLIREYGVSLRSGVEIPKEFFRDRTLLAIEPDDGARGEYETSDYWYSVNCRAISLEGYFCHQDK